MQPRFQTPWQKEKQKWVRLASDANLLMVIAEVARLGKTDENGGDSTETRETILWLATRGKRGCEWGNARAAAERIGLWAD